MNSKNSELRMAVIDGYSANISTYDNIVITYPGYLAAMNDSGVTNDVFEQFCVAPEDSMDNYGAVEPEDPFLPIVWIHGYLGHYREC